jgi:hypothetical protein
MRTATVAAAKEEARGTREARGLRASSFMLHRHSWPIQCANRIEKRKKRCDFAAN